MGNRFLYYKECLKKIYNDKFISNNIKGIIIYYTINDENAGE